MELVIAEQLTVGREEWAEQVTERDGAPAGGDNGDRLLTSHLTRQVPCDVAQWLGKRSNRAEVWARTDDHLRAEVAQTRYRVGKKRHRVVRLDAVRDVVRADEDQRH